MNSKGTIVHNDREKVNLWVHIKEYWRLEPLPRHLKWSSERLSSSATYLANCWSLNFMKYRTCWKRKFSTIDPDVLDFVILFKWKHCSIYFSKLKCFFSSILNARSIYRPLKFVDLHLVLPPPQYNYVPSLMVGWNRSLPPRNITSLVMKIGIIFEQNPAYILIMYLRSVMKKPSWYRIKLGLWKKSNLPTFTTNMNDANIVTAKNNQMCTNIGKFK